MEGQLFRVGAERLVRPGEGSRAPVLLDPVCVFLVMDLFTEVVGMRLYSVEALVGLGDHRGQHLALRPGKGGFAVHDFEVKSHRGLKGFGILAHDLHHIEDPAGTADRRVVFSFEEALRLVKIKDSDICHGDTYPSSMKAPRQ